jgi:hypothetical protein
MHPGLHRALVVGLTIALGCARPRSTPSPPAPLPSAVDAHTVISDAASVQAVISDASGNADEDAMGTPDPDWTFAEEDKCVSPFLRAVPECTPDGPPATAPSCNSPGRLHDEIPIPCGAQVGFVSPKRYPTSFALPKGP